MIEIIPVEYIYPHPQEEPRTFAGGGQPVPVPRTLNWSTQEELEEHAMITREGQLIICVYLMILTTCNTKLELRVTVT